jgi:hypothetical protein
VEKKFFETIAAIRKNDKRVTDRSAQFFDDKDFEATPAEQPKATKPIRYNDLVRQQVLQKMDKEKQGTSKGAEEPQPSKEAFADEQRRLKQELLAAAQEEGDNEGDLLRRREKTEAELADEAKSYEEFIQVRLLSEGK